MVLGCGVDIEEIDRFAKHLDLDKKPPAFIYEVFTDREIKINAAFRKELRFPIGFTCKESVFKAFGISWTNSPISWKDIELIFKGDSLTEFEIRLGGYARELFDKKGIKHIDSYLEYNDTYVMFQVVVLK
ncbi:MAG: 4'-phosphopantetheinyl transferase superfamily protein [Bacteroidales bacterium]|nr:MAG: 4'-phosphopantetheinyl transferase superfamily protein [Bacteroidales bacterium]